MSTTSDPLGLIGKQLGDYTIVNVLGRGGMASVYRGFDARLERYAAVKVIDAHLIPEQEQEEYRKRFQNEARAIARLQHSNIVGIYQFGQINTIYYMAMAFIDGKDLRQILKNHAKHNSRMAYGEVLRIIRDVGGALDYAHKEGVIHRDVKPSNIMVTPTGQAILTDFGLALSVPEGTMGATFGSAHYISPEQAISSAQAVPQSDLYSLGVVLYEMLSGRLPFNDPSAMAIALKHLQEKPQPPSEINPNISAGVEAVVLKSMSKDPTKRHATGTEMTAALQQAFALDDDEINNQAGAPISGWDDSKMTASRMDAGSTAKAGLGLEKTTASDALDDLPTVTDSKSSASIRPKVSSPARLSPTAVLGGAGVIALILIFAILTLLAGNTTQDVATPVPAQIGAQATETETQAPTEASATTPPATPTVRATATRTPDLTATAQALIPPASATPEFTHTPTLTNTRLPTETPAQAITPTVNADAGQIILYYDRQTLVLFNGSAETADVSELTFIQQPATGRALIFESRLWEGGPRATDELPAGDCFQVWTTGFATLPEPNYCGTRQAFFQAGAPRWFWIADNPDATFEVRRGTTVLATCRIGAGECVVDIQR